jgi:hypothetical protein
MLVICGICIRIKKLNVGNRRMSIQISGWHTFNFATLSYLIVPSCRRSQSQGRWCRFSLRCTCSFAPAGCLRVLTFSHLVKKHTVCVTLTNQCRVKFHCSHYISMRRKLKNPHLHISGIGTRYPGPILQFLYCVTSKSSFVLVA